MTASRRPGIRPGLRSADPPAEPVPDSQPPRMTIRLPAMASSREVLPAVTTAAGEGAENLETDPPGYTERVEPEPVAMPRVDDEPSNREPEQTQEVPSHEEGQEVPRAGPTTEAEENEVPTRPDVVPETTTITPRMNEEEDLRMVQPQRLQATLDPEIAETIRRMAQEQRQLRTEVEGSRRETFEVRVLVKTNESRLNRVFQRIGDVIDDQWVVRAGIDELSKKLQGAAGVQGQAATPNQTPIKPEPVSLNVSSRREASPEPFIVTVTDAESLSYASEEDVRIEHRTPPDQSREQGGSAGHADGAARTPGEEWVQNRDGRRRFGLGTDEALERWHAASEASRERQTLRRQGIQQQGGSGVREREARNAINGQTREQRRSVTQPHEVGFGRRPNLSTPSGSVRRASERGRQPSGGSSSGSSNDSGRGGGDPNRRSRRGSSHTGDRSRIGSRASTRRGLDDKRSSNRRRRSPLDSSSPSSSDDWDSEFTVLDDERRKRREKRERRRNPKAEYEQEQLRRIRERIRKMVGQEIQYAATYKGVKDIVTIIKYAGQNDNGIFTRWLDHLLMYFQLNRMCGPDNELVRLSAMYNSLEGVAEEWYRDLILHAPKRSWTFEKAVCSLFLTYVFGSAASQAAREFNEVKYSRTEGAREYAQRLKTKARRLARKPDESTMIVRFLAGLPSELSRRLTLRERLDPARHRFKHFVAKLHELEEAENVTRTVNAAVVDEQRKTGAQGLRGPSRPRIDDRWAPRVPQHVSSPQRNTRQPMERKPEDRPAKGKGPSPDVVCFRCQGKGHYASNPACPMFEKGGGPNRQLRERPQLKAARVSEEGDEAGTSDKLSDGNGNTGEWDDGSQWESEGEESLQSHDGAQRLNKISLTDITSELEDDDLVYVRAVREKVVTTQKENPARAAMHPKVDRPRRSKAYESCLATFVVINGMEAFTLFDSGSSADTISPDFARVSDARIHTLERPIPLQLGTVGSRASINYGTWTSVELGDRREDRYYLDVVNIDRYDAILGAPFMRKFGVRLDFGSNSIIVEDTAIEALLPAEEAALLKGRDTHQRNRRDGRAH